MEIGDVIKNVASIGTNLMDWQLVVMNYENQNKLKFITHDGNKNEVVCGRYVNVNKN